MLLGGLGLLPASAQSLGPEFPVNAYTTSRQNHSAVAADSAGNFVVVWQSVGQDGSGYYGIFGQRFDSLGTPQGGEFQVNSYTTSYQFAPAITSDADGDFVVVWGSNGSAGDDSDGYSIQGRRYDGLFRDGFESN